MAARVETKQWSTPTEKIVRGEPPRPEDHPSTLHGEARKSNIRTVTPSYKSDFVKSSGDLKIGSNTNLPTANGDYSVKETQDHYKLQIIDPKVRSNANMPVSTTSVEQRRQLVNDFPSEHSKRSFLKLAPMEQRRFKSVESRPITTSTYLTESVDRHRDMEASRLKDYLREKESDANKPWSKPDFPTAKDNKENQESLRELEQIRHTIETLQKAADEGPRKDDELDDLARRNRDLLERAKNRPNDFRLVGSDVYKQEAELPQHLKDQIREMLESRISDTTQSTFQNDRSGYVTDVSSATWQFNTSQSFSPRSVVSMNGSSAPLKVDTSNLSKTLSRSNAAVQTSHLEDERPRSIMKRRELESKDRMMYAEPPAVRNGGGWETTTRVIKPGVTETVQRFEETKRTEEVERRVQRKERKEKKHRSSHRRQEAVEWSGGQQGAQHHRSSSMGRGYTNGQGQLPAYESYQHSTTTRRPREQREQEVERRAESQSHQFQRFGSNVSNSLRRGEMKYNPNGDLSHNGRVHKSYSTRDVFHDGGRDFDDYSRSQQYSSHHRRNSHSNQPLVEFPPTLPRDSGVPPMPPPHRGGGGGRASDFYRPISKARSYADWDSSMRRYDDDMSRLENEFRDSLLMPLPKHGGNMHEKDYRTEQIPGGYESMNRETKSNSGRRLNRDGVPSNFQEASQEYNYSRATESNRPY